MWYVLNITDIGVDGRTLGLPAQMYNQIGGKPSFFIGRTFSNYLPFRRYHP